MGAKIHLFKILEFLKEFSFLNFEIYEKVVEQAKKIRTIFYPSLTPGFSSGVPGLH